MRATSRIWMLLKASWASIESVRYVKGIRYVWCIPSVALVCITVVFCLFAGIAESTGVYAQAVSQSGKDLPFHALLWRLISVFSFFWIHSVSLVTGALFFSSVSVAFALNRFNGGCPLLKDVLRIAAQRVPAIATYAAIVVTIGWPVLTLLKWIPFGGVGQMIFVAYWALIHTFVLPILVEHNIGPIQAFRKSAALLRRSYGEAVFGIGLRLFFLFLVVTGPLCVAAIGKIIETVGLGELVSEVIQGVISGSMIVAALLSYLLADIYMVALYRFSETGSMPAQSEREISPTTNEIAFHRMQKILGR